MDLWALVGIGVVFVGLMALLIWRGKDALAEQLLGDVSQIVNEQAQIRLQISELRSLVVAIQEGQVEDHKKSMSVYQDVVNTQREIRMHSPCATDLANIEAEVKKVAEIVEAGMAAVPKRDTKGKFAKKEK